jgi:uncharacterized membrane protein
MRDSQIRTTIQAPIERVWNVLADLEVWPQWTRSIDRIEFLTDPPLRIGSQVRIYQPRLRPAVWIITEWQPLSRFVWTSSHPGISVTGEHALSPSNGGCMLTLKIHFTGLFGSLVGLLTRKITRQYIEMEATGLKMHCEA